MTDTHFLLGDRRVRRMGYGAMQLAGPGVFGPPKDHMAALAVLREAAAAGIDHIDTSDFYGPHITNQLIRDALHPYADELTIVTKVGARRGADASWLPAQSPADLTQAVHDNLRNLAMDRLHVVNLRITGEVHAPSEGSIAPQFTALAALQAQGLIEHLGISNATRGQIAEARTIAPVVCVQNHYNLAHREDDALIDELAEAGIAYVPFFPLGGFTPLQSSTLVEVAAALGATPMQTALAWLLHRAPNPAADPGHVLRRASARKSCRVQPDPVRRDSVGARYDRPGIGNQAARLESAAPSARRRCRNAATATSSALSPASRPFSTAPARALIPSSRLPSR